ncbi:MAG: outer membrane beta-barrel protein [Fimbriimonadaceae bacterium]|nr:outer membrane beta-barrel protein [Chitinophagales bacterium]
MRTITPVLFLFLYTYAHAQYLEIGATGGASMYKGDLTSTLLKLDETHLATGVFTKYNFNPYFSLKASVQQGKISAADSNSTDAWRQRRNLSFQSSLLEASLSGELNLRAYTPHNRKNIFTPYAFLGIGIYHFNPQALYNGIWYELQPLGTEGQGTTAYPDREKYKLTQIAIPGGIGIKGAMSREWTIGFEIGWRKTFNDYLDDVSSTYVEQDILEGENGELSWELSNRMDETPEGMYLQPGDDRHRGDSHNLDWYLFSGVAVSYNFNLLGWEYKYTNRAGGKYKGFKYRDKKLNCPGNLN